MKVIIPLAGKGTRLLPLTRHVPKPLVRVAGRPVLDWVMDTLGQLDLDELIFITGHLKEQVESFVRSRYDLPARFVEQKVQDGTAGAVALAKEWVDGPVLIVFVDTLFDADLTIINRVQADGVIWAKEVDDYQRFGVVVTDQDSYMTRIVEKPSEPISRLANIGLYYIRDWRTLYEGIADTMARPQNKGEWFLTHAFQYMIDHGRRLYTARVDGWYDCGKVETVLETNRHLLAHGHAHRPATVPTGVTLVDPVQVADDAVLADCTIGPDVTIEAGAEVRGATIENAIVGRGARVLGGSVRSSLVGDGTVVEGRALERMVAAPDETAPAP